MRENISVYWPKENFLAFSKKFSSNDPVSEVLFLRGGFIIPFSGNEFKDALITAIIIDYNQTHELEDHDLIRTGIYTFHEPLATETDKLIEPKIIQFLGSTIRYSWPVYLEHADDGGFLTFEYLIENEAEKLLCNKDFNVFIWPYLPDKATYFEQFKTFTNTHQTNAIRKFVNNGGGFIGTCYGAYAASSGALFLTTPLSLYYANHPESSKIFPSFSLSLSDSIMRIHLDSLVTKYLSVHNVEMVDHPVFYGVSDNFTDISKGPLWAWIGKDTRILTTIVDLKNMSDCPKVNERTKKIMVGRPSWIETNFGQGKVILYSTHPDFVNNIKPIFSNGKWDGDPHYGRRVIHNTMFHVTSINNISLTTTHGVNFSFIQKVEENTKDLQFHNLTDHNFDNISFRLSELYERISSLNNSLKSLQNMFLPYNNKSKIFDSGSRFLRYGIWYCEIYQNYINRTFNIIDKLVNVTPLLRNFNETIDEKIINLRNDMNYRINQSEGLITDVENISERLESILKFSNITILNKLQLLSGRRELTEQYEICLKFIPQLYFETLKLLRYSWYSYEAYVGSSIDNNPLNTINN